MSQSGNSSNTSRSLATSKHQIDLLDDGNLLDDDDNDGTKDNDDGMQDAEWQQPTGVLHSPSRNFHSGTATLINAGYYFQPQMILMNHYLMVLPMQQGQQWAGFSSEPSRMLVDMSHAAAAASLGHLWHHIQPQFAGLGSKPVKWIQKSAISWESTNMQWCKWCYPTEKQ